MSLLEYRKLSEEELNSALADLPDWKLDDGMLARTFEFKAYKEGLVFATAVGYLADRLNHHPDLHIGYGKVKVATVTHDTGGLTPYDVALAKLVQDLV